MLYNGESVQIDYSRAAFLFKKAADLGNRQVVYCYGYINRGEYGFPGDRSECIKYLTQAKELGISDASLYLGLVLRENERAEEPSISDENESDGISNSDENSGVYIERPLYFMINRQGFYRINAEGSYRFDGTYFSPYINGDFRQKATRAYKFDGIYFMKYENGNFV